MRRHCSDEELMRWTDGELPVSREAEVAAHLRVCAECQARQAELQGGLADFVQARASQLEQAIPEAPWAEARLRSRMQDAPWPESGPKYALPALALAATMTIVGLWWLHLSGGAELHKPDAQLTPGATVAVSREEVCAVPDADEARVVPASLAGQVFQNYRLQPKPRAYEVDYLIAPALGGATDVRNLWPQPYSGVWTAHVKDALEDRLRGLVCDGKVDLATAQQEIASDWIAAYRKYFHTDRPLAMHTAYLKDRPWE